MDDLKIRIVTEADAKELREIYEPYVRNTAITFEYEVPTIEEFKQRINHTLNHYPYLAAEQDGEIIGYAYAGEFSDRPAYDWVVETSIYVRRNLRRKGAGRMLYEALEKILRAQGIVTMNGYIASPDEEDEYLSKDSVRFHEKMGFSLVGESRSCGYKFGRWYNMSWWEKPIGEHLENQPQVVWWPEIKNRIEL